jgi:hypothetical protein
MIIASGESEDPFGNETTIYNSGDCPFVGASTHVSTDGKRLLAHVLVRGMFRSKMHCHDM